ncbi:hypothetical protein SSPO_095850 [Streptomyces antimycoticus]|uniref:IspG TIM-barrel domain-containing protein n=1 Tax=Streptomyces antimycoticus TaxID=68175 RepID=A0A499VKZ9_9ACTN|nr:hypothetical protein SSPO_095850 [Streptomyces antimycoticus]
MATRRTSRQIMVGTVPAGGVAPVSVQRGFTDLKISVKHHDSVVMIEAYRKLAGRCDYPLHLGVTEVGPRFRGVARALTTGQRLTSDLTRRNEIK